jgi:hypothetical protein
MALTIASGVDGSVTFVTGHAAKFDSWTMRAGQRLNNITGFDSGGFEENLGGLKFGEGSCTGHLKYGVASSAPGMATFAKAGGAATFQVATGCTLAATIIVSDGTISSDVNGAARVAYNYRTAGTITETWAVA